MILVDFSIRQSEALLKARNNEKLGFFGGRTINKIINYMKEEFIQKMFKMQ